MAHRLESIARVYTKGFLRFTSARRDICNNSVRRSLFVYSMKKLFSMSNDEYSLAISQYGDACVRYLSECWGVPRDIENFSFDERVEIIQLCENYLSAYLDKLYELKDS